MKTAEDNSLNIGRDDITTTALFMHVPRPPERTNDEYGYQCRFGVNGNYVVQRYIMGGWTEVEVYRDIGKDCAELRINTHLSAGGKSNSCLMLSADDMQRIACALLDAAHHLRTVAATVEVAA